MKKLIALIVTLMMVLALFAGCAGNAGKTGNDKDNDEQETAESVETEDTGADDITTDDTEEVSEVTASSSGYPIPDSFNAYTEAKGVVINKLMDGLSNNPDTAMASLSFFGVSMVDAVLIPVAFFGMDEAAAAAGMEYLSGTDVSYTSSGNTYTLTYTDSEGKVQSLTGVWDAAADWLVCTGSTDGVENFYSEYRKTSYGYVGQYFFTNDDGTATIYKITVQGEDGALGISAATEKPAALTGGEPVEFPQSCTEWYAINGTTITGMTTDGTALNFEYTPTETEE